jgi:hypothetical protein
MLPTPVKLTYILSFSNTQLPVSLNSIMRDSPEIAIMKGNKEIFIQMIKDNYKAKTEKYY